MKKLVLSMSLILLFLFSNNVNVKAEDGWFTPDLRDYTFSVDFDNYSLKFKANELISGNFYDFLYKDYDFGVYQEPNGALRFGTIRETLLWVAEQSLMGGKYGITPMSFNGLPSYVSYNIYNDYNPMVYKGAVNRHTVIYRLDFWGNYAMRLNDYIYDYVYSLEVIYYIYIDYANSNYQFYRGYTVNWYDRNYMIERKLYTDMHSDVIQFELYSYDGPGYEMGYTDGYDNGYDDGYSVGYDEGYNEGILVDESEAYQEGFRDGENSKLSKNTESFYSGIEKWLVPAIITVIALGGFVSIAAIKRREQ